MTHFHSASNQPGYLPEGDIGTHDTAEEAWRSVAEEISRAWDSEYEVTTEEASEEREEIDARYLDAHTAAGLAGEPGTVHVPGPTTTHLGVVWWVSACDNTDCEEGEEA